MLSAFWRVLERAAQTHDARLVLIDVGPNLGVVNRAALITAEYVAIPLAPDLYSLRGLQNLGPTLRGWRREWKERLSCNPVHDLSLPGGQMRPVGYIVLQHAVRFDRPVQAYDRWMGHIAAVYREAVLDEDPTTAPSTIDDDPYCLAALKPYRSLMPLAQEARKPMFALKPADGALGVHARAVQECFKDFRVLVQRIAGVIEFPMP